MSYRKKPARIQPDAADRLCSPAETAELLGIAPQTMAHWRVRGCGPRYLLLNRRCVRYRLSDIRAWLESRTQESTAENELL